MSSESDASERADEESVSDEGSISGGSSAEETRKVSAAEICLKTELLNDLDEIEEKSSFSFYERHSSSPNPCLHVKGYGLIPLPLTARDAKVIARAGSPVPLPVNETAVGRPVCHTWELNNEQFKFENPEWQQFVDNVLPAWRFDASKRI
ncbi:hypothetical protein NA57DRAFT_71560 [Rhizodiscina lignyota]|uniref:Uncharacterized protein n=1 Tax=Rhizodiscina lignyota TaxID=1504668 RepID=A0A9P4IQU2_9PEZI|nr:hypothetical protein NA57DRAFT_71560 [Rhizodiscina lignyota]